MRIIKFWKKLFEGSLEYYKLKSELRTLRTSIEVELEVIHSIVHKLATRSGIKKKAEDLNTPKRQGIIRR